MERKSEPQNKGGRSFDELSASAKAIHLWKAGYSQAEAARTVGITQGAVAHAIARRRRAKKEAA